jgi:glycosyltransferase involved in cell wall biosynthesis
VRRVQLLALHLLSGRLLLEFLEMRRRLLGAMREVVAAARDELEPLRCRGLPLVTVCIPTRNEECFIGQALFALRRVNLYPRLEIIVADYASRDATVEIAGRFGAKVVSLDKPGVGRARHECSLEARGEIVVQIDADTVVTPFAIPRAVAHLLSGRVHVYHTAHYYYDGDALLNLAAHYYDKYFRKPYRTTGHFIAYTRDLYDCVQFDPNVSWGEDYDFGERAFKKFGNSIFKFDRETIVLVSSRMYRRRGALSKTISAMSRGRS